MAPESPPQPAKAGCEARLFSISSFGKFQLLAEMHGLAGDGAGIMREEPAVEAIYQPGDLLLAVQFEGKVHMAYISRVEVGGGSDEEEGSRSGGSEKKGSGGSEEEGSRSGGSEEEWSRSGSEEEWSRSGSEEDGSIRGSEEDGSIRGSEEEQSDQTSTNSSSVTEADDKEKSHTVKELNEKKRHLQIRIWQEYCVLALYEGERWKVTKQQPIQWLQEDQIEETRDKIKIENDRNEVKMTWNLDFLGLSKQMCIFGFSGPLESSEAVEIFINSELSPDIMDYNITKLLGSGATCEVYRVDTTYAIKMMKLDKNFDDTYALEYKEPREVTILSSFSHSAVVSFFQAWAADGIYKIYLKGSSSEGSGERFDDENSDPDDNLEDERELKYVAIQMECCGRFSHKHEKHLLTLLDLLDAKDRKIDVEEAWFLFKEIAKGVQGIHRKGVIHRDLKPRNIFFGHAATNTIKIGDFGHACWAKQYAAAEGGTPNRGTSGYSAPELAGEKPSPTYKADIYSLGIILLDLFYLFKSSHQRSEVLTKLGTDQYPNPADPDWYGDVTLLKKLVASSPSERPSADEILEYISNRGL